MPNRKNTNNAFEVKAKIWAFEGDNFWIFLGAIGISAMAFMLMGDAGYSFTATASVTSIPIIISCIWVLGFRQGKPPSYDVDFFQTLFLGHDWEPNWKKQPRHPLVPPPDSQATERQVSQ